jgi:hypothetical protein
MSRKGTAADSVDMRFVRTMKSLIEKACITAAPIATPGGHCLGQTLREPKSRRRKTDICTIRNREPRYVVTDVGRGQRPVDHPAAQLSRKIWGAAA